MARPKKGCCDPLETGLSLLYRARRYSLEAENDIWDFALEITELRRAGLTNNEFRLLLAKGLVEHAEETTIAYDGKRTFRPLCRHAFPDRTCFVLTPAGEQAASSFQGRHSQTNDFCSLFLRTNPKDSLSNGKQVLPSTDTKPAWDAERKELHMGQHLIKLFKWPSPNQETILAVFEEEGWPARIDDPLPVVPEQDPKRRLHDTIKCLNRNHKVEVIRFRGDGTGEGVVWGFTSTSQGKRA